jgi:hypothetical protein
MAPAFPDPLRIHYLILLDDEEVHDASPLQGFSDGWRDVGWALDLIAVLPADVVERASPPDGVKAQRMGGMRQPIWSPLMISALESLKATELGLFVVLFTGQESVAKRAATWVKEQQRPILHISSVEGADATFAGNFDPSQLRDYCERVFSECSGELSGPRKKVVEAALKNWKEPEPTNIDLKAWLHNATAPNHASLARAALKPRDPEPFIGRSEDEYSKVIVESATAVESERDRVGYRDFHRLSLIHPELFLVEPALYRFAYRRFRAEGPLADKTAFEVFRMLQSQKGLHNTAATDFPERLQQSAIAQQILAVRGAELNVFTAAVGLRAAQTCSAVLRLSPGVNHVFPALGNYARSVRSDRVEGRLKAGRLFKAIQDELARAVGEARLNFIGKGTGPVKIVCDAPIEWLPIRGLPLSLRRDCSRINATPGNLLIGQLARSEPITVTPDALRNVLLISSFADKDPLRNLVRGSLMATYGGWVGKVEVSMVSVNTRAEFISAVNDSEAPILIFDGHGSGNPDTGIATLEIGSESVNVWELRDEIEVPPIVILSACDTQGIDARSHATVGNGFLAIGAQTVVATLLPVDGRASAGFIARLIYRLADFIPAVLTTRVVNWTEIVSGMLRMLLVSEILDGLVGPPAEMGSPRATMQSQANAYINSGDSDWFEQLISDIAKHRAETEDATLARAQGIIARAEALRYVQLGNPENILVDDGSIRGRFIPKEVEAELTGA